MCRTESNTSTLDEQCSENDNDTNNTNNSSSNINGDTKINKQGDEHQDNVPPLVGEHQRILHRRPAASGGRGGARRIAVIMMASVVLVAVLAVRLEVLGNGMVGTSTTRSSPPEVVVLFHFVYSICRSGSGVNSLFRGEVQVLDNAALWFLWS